MITNVIREDEGWWRGEFQGITGWFPSNHVAIIEDNSILGDLQKGCIDLTGAVVDLRHVSGGEFAWRVFIDVNGNVRMFGVEREEDGIAWVEAIRGVGESVNERVKRYFFISKTV